MKRLTVLLMAFFITASFLILVSCSSFNATSEIITDQKDTLKDVKSIFVDVEILGRAAEKMGLTWDLIKPMVESQLRRNGINVDEIEEGEPVRRPKYASEHLNVKLKVIDTTISMLSQGLIYDLSLEFKQNVNLQRNGALYFGATTWQLSSLHSIKYKGGKDAIIEEILEKVDTFSNEFLSVND